MEMDDGTYKLDEVYEEMESKNRATSSLVIKIWG
jgi:hypothetical protein